MLESEIPLGNITPNIAGMLRDNCANFGNHFVYREKQEGKFQGITWEEFYQKIQSIATCLNALGFSEGEKVVIFSPNRLEMLLLELSVMAMGGIAVPIFAYYKKETAELLIRHSDAKFIAVAGQTQLNEVSTELRLKYIFHFDDEIKSVGYKNLFPFSELTRKVSSASSPLKYSLPMDTICLNMYTSGTMGIPKCVQLTHKNILSQQEALNVLWNIEPTDRFLSYLPWHHSFGGIFELFTSLYHGATYNLEPGYGKDPKSIMENWRVIQPNLFFSVPKVYQSLVELAREDKEAEKLFFHRGLKFVFTAAAPLPENISREFEERNIPVIEGWGLTETSPCCTLTNPKIKRETGVVGKPIPGVSIRLGEENEIQVKGPNVMTGYYKNDKANKETFTWDGWFRTGDVGEFTDAGLKLISRKDRIFKLTNGEKVIPSEVETVLHSKCHYISFALVIGNGQEFPVALIFPNKKMIEHPDYQITPVEGCFCPRDLSELGKCLHGCLNDANCGIGQKFSRIKAAMLIDDELSVEKNTITPSMKVAPNNVADMYKGHIENLYGGKNILPQEVYIIKMKEDVLSD